MLVRKRNFPGHRLRGIALARPRRHGIMAGLEPDGRLQNQQSHFAAGGARGIMSAGAKGAMKALLAAGLLAAMSGAAAANLAPRAPAPPPHGLESWLIGLGPVGAMLESDYFRAPQSPFAGGPVVPCRLRRSSTAGEIHLSFSCR